MLGSTNHFFTQSALKLTIGRVNVIDLLTIKGYNAMSIEVYLKAYDYFCVNPNNFDGATCVKDLCDLPDLDLDALLHDYHYIAYNVGSSFDLKTKADWLYAKGNERKGKGIYSAYSRFAGLTITTPFFSLFARLKRGKVTKEQREKFLNDYNILLNLESKTI